MLSYHADFVMADPAQLRKCEELLAKLPEKPPARVRNPVWVFLRGLEGFDTERASECLVKLLDKHYDTIGVLKLATKRDLVEDAGILPGDALRIVAAAKEYVAPCDAVDPSPEPTSQHDVTKPVQGVEHRQDAYRPPALREATVIFTPPVASQCSSHAHSSTTVMQQQKVMNQGAASEQEAVKEGKVGKEVEPKEEAVKEDAKAPADPTLPPPRRALVDGKTGYAPADPTLPPSWRALVDGKTGYVYYWNSENNITQYGKPLPLLGSGPPLPSGPPPPGPPPRWGPSPGWSPPPSSGISGPKLAVIPPTIPVGITYPHICRMCNAKCISESHVQTHYNGRRHIEAVREAKQPAQIPKAVNPAVKETEAAQPQVVWGLKQPSQPQQVASGAKQPSQSIPVAPLHACGVCNVKCGSEIVLRSHFNGKKHAQKMELATDSEDNGPTAYLYCSVCDVTSNSKRSLVMHFNGKRHAKNMKEDSDSGDSSYYSDSESDY